MRNREVVRYKQQIDHLISEAGRATGNDPELLAHWARYLCILVSGLLEVSIRSVYSEYVKARAAPYVANYVETQLRSFQNPKCEKIFQLIGSFNPEWVHKLNELIDEQVRLAVDSIVTNRHQIAHGRSVGITLSQIQTYYREALRLIEAIESLLQ